MRKKVEKILIGTDITRTGSLVIGGSGDNIATGELVVLDKNRAVLSAGATYSDTDTIYIVEGLSDTYNYVDGTGTAITGVAQLRFSDAIKGDAVVEYSGKAYAAAAEQVTTVNFGTITPIVGEEYVLRIVYRDLTPEHPGQFTYTYRVISSSAVAATLYDQFVAEINSHVDRRILATDNNTYITLTGLAYDDNAAIDSINEYAQVSFEVALLSDNFAADAAVSTTTAPYGGAGTYRLVRDEEKYSQGYEGLLNRTCFPVQVPTFRTVLNETYNCLVIRHKNWYTSVGNREEQVDITTKLYIPNTSTANQTDDVLAVLNPWMASLPKAFANVTF